MIGAGSADSDNMSAGSRYGEQPEMRARATNKTEKRGMC
jgi:hypothetical protein